MEDHHLKPSIGFIGMGHMGSHMVQRLLNTISYPITVYDRTREKAQAIEQQHGVKVAQTPRDLSCRLPDCDGLCDG